MGLGNRGRSRYDGSVVRKRAYRPILFVLVAVGLFVGAREFMKTWFPYVGSDATNYEVVYEVPTGWNKERPGPQQLFRFRHPDTKVFIIGAVSRVVDEVNPTPELTTDGIAEQYIGVTKANFDGWTARRLEDETRGSERFSMIERAGPDRTTLTAYSVRGNTTLIVSMGANGGRRENLAKHLGDFRRLLSEIRFREKVYAAY
ncbi:MAG: hypothetical protein KIS66_05205 [Fimbriimonadaceae bacterium]|nr:hypothetical protein [Fimbriimonadaceae bacterium]